MRCLLDIQVEVQAASWRGESGIRGPKIEAKRTVHISSQRQMILTFWYFSFSRSGVSLPCEAPANTESRLYQLWRRTYSSSYKSKKLQYSGLFCGTSIIRMIIITWLFLIRSFIEPSFQFGSTDVRCHKLSGSPPSWNQHINKHVDNQVHWASLPITH